MTYILVVDAIPLPVNLEVLLRAEGLLALLTAETLRVEMVRAQDGRLLLDGLPAQGTVSWKETDRHVKRFKVYISI